jgi:hypothetical protein
MSLINDQAVFLKQLCDTIAFAEQLFTVTEGEGERTQAQHDLNLQEGRSKTKRSRHQDRLAHDLHFYELVSPSGKFIEVIDKGKLQPIGDYWKLLDSKNSWGGDWKNPYDPWHFERNVL